MHAGPFRYFRAPTQTAEAYVADRACSFCGARARDAFVLGAGADIILECPSCLVQTAVDAESGSTPCHACATTVESGLSGELVTCIECLAGGRVALTKDTEFGLISWTDVMHAAETGGVLLPDAVDDDDEEDSDGLASLQHDSVLDLLRTPSYPTYQGERWLFHHDQPMAYIGRWSAEEFTRAAEDRDPRDLFDELCAADAPGRGRDDDDDAWALLTEPEHGTLIGVYMFECTTCSVMRGTWDID